MKRRTIILNRTESLKFIRSLHSRGGFARYGKSPLEPILKKLSEAAERFAIIRMNGIPIGRMPLEEQVRVAPFSPELFKTPITEFSGTMAVEMDMETINRLFGIKDEETSKEI